MSTALLSGLIILVLLLIMLIAGVPIAVALGISSICAILPVMDTSVAVLTGGGRKIFCVYGKNSSLIRNRYVIRQP